MIEEKEETKTEEKSFAEIRAELHTLIDKLADMAEKDVDPAIDLLNDFGTFGAGIIETNGEISLDEIISASCENICEDCNEETCNCIDVEVPV